MTDALQFKYFGMWEHIIPGPFPYPGVICPGCITCSPPGADYLADPHFRIRVVELPSMSFLRLGDGGDGPGVRDTTRQRFAAWGITPDRLLPEGTSLRAKTLEAHNRVDTFRYRCPTALLPLPSRILTDTRVVPIKGGNARLDLGVANTHNAISG